MAFIKMATRFGTQSFYSNGQLIGLTCPNAYGMGSITYAPFEASPVERTMEHQDGTFSHFDGQGHMTGTSYQDLARNSSCQNNETIFLVCLPSPCGRFCTYLLYPRS